MSYKKNIIRAFDRFTEELQFSAQPTRGEATIDNPRFDFRFIRKSRDGYPDEEDIKAVAALSDANERIRIASNLSLDERIRLYTVWFRANPKTFGLLVRYPADSKGISVIGNTAILPLTPIALDHIKRSGLVTGLGPNDFSTKSEMPSALLLDTWVLQSKYLRSSWFARHSITHKGFANGLVLRHIAAFWDPASTNPIQIYAEPDSDAMQRMLPRLGFKEVGQTGSDEPLMCLTYPPEGDDTSENILERQALNKAVANIKHWATW